MYGKIQKMLRAPQWRCGLDQGVEDRHALVFSGKSIRPSDPNDRAGFLTFNDTCSIGSAAITCLQYDVGTDVRTSRSLELNRYNGKLVVKMSGKFVETTEIYAKLKMKGMENEFDADCVKHKKGPLF